MQQRLHVCHGHVFLAALMLVPITGAVVPALGAPGFITVTLIFIELFGLPIIAAFIGLNIGMKLTTRSA